MHRNLFELPKHFIVTSVKAILKHPVHVTALVEECYKQLVPCNIFLRESHRFIFVSLNHCKFATSPGVNPPGGLGPPSVGASTPLPRRPWMMRAWAELRNRTSGRCWWAESQKRKMRRIGGETLALARREGGGWRCDDPRTAEDWVTESWLASGNRQGLEAQPRGEAGAMVQRRVARRPGRGRGLADLGAASTKPQPAGVPRNSS